MKKIMHYEELQYIFDSREERDEFVRDMIESGWTDSGQFKNEGHFYCRLGKYHPVN